MCSYPGDESFCFTHGDGVAGVVMGALIVHHRPQSLQAGLTAVQPPGRYGALHLDGDCVGKCRENADDEQARIDVGFLVLEPSVCDRIHSDA
ncbi:MAG: hypothetical protein R6U00_01585 [Prochlorococcaceae cyanobacterium]